jgi:hypothetical protein
MVSMFSIPVAAHGWYADWLAQRKLASALLIAALQW